MAMFIEELCFICMYMTNDDKTSFDVVRDRVATVTAVENHPIPAERGLGRHDIQENFCSRSLSRLLKLESKQANMMQESLKVYRLVIFLALAVCFVSGKINVTNNIIVLHRPFGIVFQF